MSPSGAPLSETLSAAELLHLFLDESGSPASRAAALATAPADYTFELLLRRGVTADRVAASGVTVQRLCRMFGLRELRQLQQLGYDAAHVSQRESAAAQLLRASFSHQDIKSALLCAPGDAVHLAGSYACSILGVHTGDLLDACDGDAAHSDAVLTLQKECGHDALMRGLSIEHVLRSGLGGEALRRHGLGTATLARIGATDVRCGPSAPAPPRTLFAAAALFFFFSLGNRPPCPPHRSIYDT